MWFYRFYTNVTPQVNSPHKGELIHDRKGELESQLNVALAIKENNLTLTAFKLK